MPPPEDALQVIARRALCRYSPAGYLELFMPISPRAVRKAKSRTGIIVGQSQNKRFWRVKWNDLSRPYPVRKDHVEVLRE